MNTYEGRSRNSGAAEQRCELLYSQIRADADVTVESQPMGRGGFQPYLNEWRRAQHTTLLVSEAHHKATAPPVGQGVHGKGRVDLHVRASTMKVWTPCLVPRFSFIDYAMYDNSPEAFPPIF